MMNRQQILDIIAAHQDELRAMGVSSLKLFGSYARDEAREDSDVDLLVEFDSRPIGLFEYAGIEIKLQEWLGVEKVDLVMPSAIYEELKEDILGNAPAQQRKWKFRVRHMLESIARIEEWTKALEYDTFIHDKMTTAAVEYELERIGEFIRFVPEQVKDRYPQIEWKKSQALRDVLLHGYVKTDLTVVWDAIQKDLPPLKQQLQLLYGNEHDE